MISSPLEKLNADSNIVALSRLGYPIPIFDENGDWLEKINVVDDGAGPQKLDNVISSESA